MTFQCLHVVETVRKREVRGEVHESVRGVCGRGAVETST